MEFIKAFHIDAGRKYYSFDSLIDLINVCAENDYNTIELAIGNDGYRFLLDDMSVQTSFKLYESVSVKEALHIGNITYCDNGTNELTERELAMLIEHANNKGLQVIPLLNTPGHMNALLTAMEHLGIADPSYKNSKTTVDLENSEAVEFTKAFLSMAIKWFANKGCKYFNLGSDEYANDVLSSGFEALQNPECYAYNKFISYVNDIAAIIKSNNMIPIMFNDGVYYNRDLSGGRLDSDIVVSYWSFGWPGYTPAPVDYIEAQGYKIIDTCADWYYVLGRTENDGGNQDFTFQSSLKALGSGQSFVSDAMLNAPIGCMFCLWSDDPTVPYNENEVERMHTLIPAFAPTIK